MINTIVISHPLFVLALPESAPVWINEINKKIIK